MLSEDNVSFPAAEGLQSGFFRAGDRSFFGFVLDPEDLIRKFTVEILVDGYPLKVMRADSYVHHLAREQVGDGCYGFAFSLPDSVVCGSTILEARLANVEAAIGSPILLDRIVPAGLDRLGPGAVRWLGGLRFSGWLAPNDEPPTALALVDGVRVTRILASTWSHVGSSEDPQPVRGFDFHLPQKFADGDVHQLVAVNDKGESLAGSPIGFIAFADTMREIVTGPQGSGREALRAELLNKLLPMSLPFSQYQNWRERFPIVPGCSGAQKCAVVMIGPGATDDTVGSLHEQTHTDWVAAQVPQTGEPLGFPALLVKNFLETDGADCEFVVFVLAGTRLAPLALQRIANAFSAHDAQIVYGDLDIQSEDGSVWPLALPAFDYERMLEQGYCAHLFAINRGRAERSLGDGGYDFYRLFYAALEDTEVSRSAIVHLPGALGRLPLLDRQAASTTLMAASRAHLGRKGVAADLTAGSAGIFPAVRVARHSDHLSTTIIIPIRNQRAQLTRCIESIRPAVSRQNAEIIVVDNDSTDPETLKYLEEIEENTARILRVPGDFNLARLNNCAATAARSEILCLLNHNTKATDNDWLPEMLSRITDPQVGAVGALLLWPSGVVQHGGLVLGPNFAPAHAFCDRVRGDDGYGDLLCVAHECSAVSAACLLTRRNDYLAVGGMDEVRFPIKFNDVDFCLKLRARDKRIVFTPHARLLCLQSASLGPDHHGAERNRVEREYQNLRNKWGSVLAADPYYSPVLSLDPVPFSALAWPARSMEPRTNRSPTPVIIPPEF